MTKEKVTVAGLAALAVAALGTGVALAAGGTTSGPSNAPLTHSASTDSVGPSDGVTGPANPETTGPATPEPSDATETPSEATDRSTPEASDSAEPNSGETAEPSSDPTAHSDDQGENSNDQGASGDGQHQAGDGGSATSGPTDTRTDSQGSGSGDH